MFAFYFYTFSDTEELQAGTNRTDPADTPPVADSDGDGVSDAVDKALEASSKEQCTANSDCVTKVCSSGLCLGPGEQTCESVSDCRSGACAMSSGTANETVTICCRSGESIDNICTGQFNGSPCTDDAVCASSNCVDGICETLRQVEKNILNDDEDEDDVDSIGCGTGCKAGASVGAVAGVALIGAGAAAMKKKEDDEPNDGEEGNEVSAVEQKQPPLDDTMAVDEEMPVSASSTSLLAGTMPDEEMPASVSSTSLLAGQMPAEDMPVSASSTSLLAGRMPDEEMPASVSSTSLLAGRMPDA